MQDPAIIRAITELIDICGAGEEGFGACASQAVSVELKALFTWRAGECRHHAAELRALLDQTAADHSAADDGNARQAWLQSEPTSAGRGDVGLLEHAEAGEQAALQHYRRCLTEHLPEPMQAVLQRQADAISRHHAQLLTLRDRARKG